MRARSLAVLLPVLLVAPAAPTASDGLTVDPKDPRFAGHAELLTLIGASPHGYFRFVNAAFAAETCRLFADVVDQMPEVNLHGDAHVEQYTVTNLGRGLSDFDDCTRGKAVIDLVRLGTSLLIAAREKGWARDEMSFVDRVPDAATATRSGAIGCTCPPRSSRPVRARRSSGTTRARCGRRTRWIDKSPLPNDAFADGVGALRRARRLRPRARARPLQGEADRLAGDGRGQRPRREVPDPVRGAERRRPRTT